MPLTTRGPGAKSGTMPEKPKKLRGGWRRSRSGRSGETHPMDTPARLHSYNTSRRDIAVYTAMGIRTGCKRTSERS